MNEIDQRLDETVQLAEKPRTDKSCQGNTGDYRTHGRVGTPIRIHDHGKRNLPKPRTDGKGGTHIPHDQIRTKGLDETSIVDYIVTDDAPGEDRPALRNVVQKLLAGHGWQIGDGEGLIVEKPEIPRGSVEVNLI